MQSFGFGKLFERDTENEPIRFVGFGILGLPVSVVSATTRSGQESALLSAINHADRATDKARFRRVLDRVRHGN